MKLGNCIAGARCSGFKLSKSILTFFATIFVAFLVSGSVLADSPCDTTNEINHYILVFDTVIYEPPGTSQWVYNLTWDGTPPALSHFMIELCTLITNANLLAVEPDFGSIGLDGSTGLYGIKWDNIENFPANSAVTFSFTLDDSLPVDHTQFAPKAGINSNIATICGPTLDCEDPCANDNTPPIIVCPADITVSNDPGQCSAVVTYSATASDDCSAASISCSPPSGSVFPVGTTTVTCIATDESGNADTCTFNITVNDTEAPVATCPADITISNDPGQCSAVVTFSGSVTDNCAGASISCSPASGSVFPVGTTTVTCIATDPAGNADTCTFIVTVNETEAPVITCPTDITVSNDPGQCTAVVTYSVSATDNCSETSISCNPPSGSTFPVGTTTVTCIATDVSDNADTCTFDITVNDTEAPVATCPADITVGNDPGQCSAVVTFSGSVTDNCAGASISCSPASGSVFPVGTTTATCIATDESGNADTCSFNITVNDTEAPVCSVPNDTTIFLCESATICIPISATDNCDSNPTCVLEPGSPGSIVNGQWCYTTSGSETLEVEFRCTDDGGNFCISTFTVIVDPQCDFCRTNIIIEKTNNTPQGRYENVTISIENMPDSGIGGFDLLIQYDPSALSLSTVEPGDFLANCGWEYFAYRHGPTGNCGNNACPTGKVRILALAETNNGAIHPSCFYSNPAELAVMTYLVTNDRTFECQYVPIRFCWYDCGDNTLSSKAGDSLYISQAVYYYYDGVIWNEITDISAEFPSLNGANYTCDIDQGDGKPNPIRSLCFYNGGVSIVCAESIDDRGDINLNGVANEVADAVLLGNYFVYGLSVFTINLEGQIAATDVNADGTVLSVADLVYLIRIVIGDASAYSKVVTSVNIDFYHYSDGRLGVGEKTSIGAAYVVAEGEVTPILLATEMDMKYHFDGSNTRILVWSESGSGFTGDFLLLDADLISFELATAEGQPVSLNTLPTTYELLQNYPNPFNPATVISFTLPDASEYSLTIYNLNGQVVKEFEGVANSAGTVDLEWQAVDVASGVYFYRLEANYGRYVETKKMILLK